MSIKNPLGREDTKESVNGRARGLDPKELPAIRFAAVVVRFHAIQNHEISCAQQVAFISAYNRTLPRECQTNKKHIVATTVGVISSSLSVDSQIHKMIRHLTYSLFAFIIADLFSHIFKFSITVFHNASNEQELSSFLYIKGNLCIYLQKRI